MMSAPWSPIMPSAFPLHLLMAVRIPSFVGVSNGRPHSWKTPVTNSRTCTRSCSSVTGCPRRSKNCWFALSKHRRSSSRTNEGVRSASETLGAVYVSRIWSSPEVPVDNGVIFEVGAFDRRSSVDLSVFVSCDWASGKEYGRTRVEFWQIRMAGPLAPRFGENMSLRLAGVFAFVLVSVLVVVPSVQAARPGFVFPAVCCYYNGAVVRTVVPPAAFPNEGRDNFYAVMGQEIFGVVGVAPGAPGYHGGHWKFHSVTWNVAPYLLTSEAAILAAQSSGDVTVTRVPENDYLCPFQS